MPRKQEKYIFIPNWREYQHYQSGRRERPPWIKNYTKLLDNEAYRSLPAQERAILHGIWLLYASRNSTLTQLTGNLSSSLGLRVLNSHLERLNHAGFIRIVDSKTLARLQRECYHQREKTTSSLKEASATPAPRARRKPDKDARAGSEVVYIKRGERI